MIRRFDLHMHSEYSCDGEKTVAELLSLAREAGLAQIAITDHNCTEAVLPALALAGQYGVEVIPAVELDCLYREQVFHVLGYSINPLDPALKKIAQNIMDQESRAARERIAKINAAGIVVDEAEALARAVHGVFVTGELIAEIVLGKTDARKNEKLLPYLPGGARCDNPYVNFYWDWCSVGRPAYVHIEYITMDEALATLHAADGITVLAHPGQNLKDHPDWLDEILDKDFDGVECFSTYHSPEMNAYFFQKTLAKALLATGGSDFHGKTKPAIKMGEFGLTDPQIRDEIYTQLNLRLKSVKVK